MWKTCSEGQTWNPLTHDCELTAASYQWEDALFHSEMVNGLGGFANFTDWRVPNIKELLTLVEWQCEDPAINLAVFPNTGSFMNTWSSTSGDFIYHARTVQFSSGRIQSKRRIFAAHLRLVRDQ